MTMRQSYVVTFFHRGGWEKYEEYGPTCLDIAVQRATELSIPFGDAEVRLIARADIQMPWQEGTLIFLREFKKGQMTAHHDIQEG